MNPVTHCCVPGCAHWTRRFPRGGTDWLCSQHWRLVPRALKSLRTRLVQRYRRRGLMDMTELHYLPRTIAGDRMLHGVWRRMKRAAILAAAGL